MIWFNTLESGDLVQELGGVLVQEAQVFDFVVHRLQTTAISMEDLTNSFCILFQDLQGLAHLIAVKGAGLYYYV